MAMDAITPPRIRTNDLEAPRPLVLRKLRWQQPLPKQWRALFVQVPLFPGTLGHRRRSS
jgi:hypothetical protein